LSSASLIGRGKNKKRPNRGGAKETATRNFFPPQLPPIEEVVKKVEGDVSRTEKSKKRPRQPGHKEGVGRTTVKEHGLLRMGIGSSPKIGKGERRALLNKEPFRY